MGSAISPTLAAGVSPQPILEVTWAFAATQVVCTALELDLFTCLEERHATIEDVGRGNRGFDARPANSARTPWWG